MNEEKAIALINKFQRGELTPEQQVRLNEWYLMNAAESKDELSPDQLEQIVDQIRLRLPLEEPVRKVKLWPRIVAIAAAVALIISGLYFFNANKSRVTRHTQLTMHDIAPGTVGATLTLANGKKIRLTEAAKGELAREAGVVITKSANGQLIYEIKDRSGELNKMNRLTTSKGETYYVRLPDGSVVWLNAASSLTYAANLNNGGKRKVKLEGEGYFEIAKDKAHPFVVESRGQEVEVLGTHFNVNAYADEANVKTTLLEGSVNVSSTGKNVVLKPNQQAVLADNSQIIVKQIDPEEAVAWKNGDFVFDHEDFESIIRKVEKWYNVDFIYTKGRYSKLKINGSVSRSKNISSVLEALQQAGGITFKIEGRRITII